MAEQLNADVVISGGSYVGLTLALALAQELGPSCSIIIVDRGKGVASSAGSSIDPRASSISAGSRNLLARLGLWEQLAGHATPVSEIELTDSSLNAGVRPVLLTYDNTADGGAAASWIVANADLGAALELAVAAEPAIHLMRPAHAVGIVAGSACTTVALADDRRITASLAIAADGRRSLLRELAGIGLVSFDHEQTGIVTCIAHELNHRGRAVQHFLPGGPFAILPLQGGYRSCVTWSESANAAARILALHNAVFLEEVDRRVAGRLGALELDGPRRSWPLETHLARRYVAPRLALAGDAAHVVHPIAGQGLNLGFRDVAALVECLADAAYVGLDLGDATMLERYERWRRFDSGLSSATFGGLNRLFSNDWTLARSARELGLGLLDRMPNVKQRFVNAGAGAAGTVPRLLTAVDGLR